DDVSSFLFLTGLQSARLDFAHSSVYPNLADLISLSRGHSAFLDGVERFREGRPGRVTGVDWEAGALVRDPEDDEPPLLAEDLARWALPLLADVIEEGRTLFERSEEHTSELQSRENIVCRLLLEKK